MPSSRPCAAFEPISPHFDVRALVESTSNFEWVVRIHADMIDHHGLENFEKLVLIHVILKGQPLVIEGYHERLDQWTFTLHWLRDNCGSKVENARDLTKKSSVPLTITHYLNHMALLTNQWTDTNYKDPERQRMYLKDIDCPKIWADKVRDLIPLGLFYMNDSTGKEGGLGSVEEPDPSGHGTRRSRGIAKAGDLMSSLPKEMRAENLMCYIGHEGTYTPSHREMCASLGQNIMVECSSGKAEDGKPTIPGSSVWFMTETKERHVVSEYWLSRLGHDIEVENHFAQVNAWKAAPFKVYVVEQRVGDFILIPPLAPHQVWNRGTRTMKVAWNRTTVETLELAISEALPKARIVCRDEQYKNKAIVYFSLQKYSKLLKMADKVRQKKSNRSSADGDAKVRQVEKDFRRLQVLFTKILVSESFLPDQPEGKVELVPFESYITCSYCRCNIFNRFLTCPSCIINPGTADEDTYDICLDCYAMGRSCACISKLRWVEQFPWGELTQQHEYWRQQILQKEDGVTEKSPKTLRAELDRLGNKRTLAQICQLELPKRPFNDMRKPAAPAAEIIEEELVDANGNVKKKRKVRKSEKFIKEHRRCHVDCHWEPTWKQADCSTCDKRFCFGLLFRGYDQMPQDILADPSWQCPVCRMICGCRSCKNKLGFTKYTPTGTLLGHNTKAVADIRSVESLVDFSHSNISWIEKAGDDSKDSERISRRKEAAEAAKAKDLELGDNYVDVDKAAEEDRALEQKVLQLAQQEGFPVYDPALGIAMQEGVPDSPQSDGVDENPEGPHLRFEGIPPQPQFVIPEGGIVRSASHAYDFTEAITYDYPDPEAIHGLSAPPVEGAPTQNGTYKPVVPTDGPELHVQMVNRKRKRDKLDEGEKPCTPHTPLDHRAKAPERKSLIVKLPLGKEKLADINQMAIFAHHALNGTNGVSAPVLGSDLVALNASSTGMPTDEQKSLAKAAKADFAVLPEEPDEEFRPGRRRGKSGPGKGEEITRRSTRMQNVTYEAPSDEDEFEEILPQHPPRSKLATFERAAHAIAPQQEQLSVPDVNDEAEDDSANGASIPSAAHSADTHDAPADMNGSIDPALFTVSNGFTAIQRVSVAAAPAAAARAPRSVTSGKRPMMRPNSSSLTSQALAEAQANRKAKMATLDGLVDDNDVGGTWDKDDDEGSGRVPRVRVADWADDSADDD